MRKLTEQTFNRKNDWLRRLAVFLGASAIILLFSVLAPPESELFDMVGMELAIVALAIFLWKFPIGIYLAANLFTLSAAAGSILKFYDQFPGYDRVVHFISGLLLGYIGVYIINRVFARLHMESVPVLVVLFAGMFAFFGAGFWEIIEFLTDCVMHMDVQHGNIDTMGDIVAGYLGGVLYQGHLLFRYRAYFSKSNIKAFFKSEPCIARSKS